jgi:peptidoglycan/xylan/chitin deacetylase (PgdA/CDA1 family)
VAYLTFDDGPSARTLEILDILREYGISATFFVITENSNPEILRRIVAEGHAIGIHTHSHRYNEIYKSVEDYLYDFAIAYNKIYEATSVRPRIFRFPGGSINAYNSGIYQELISEMLRRGFVYFDWNVSTMDTKSDITADEIVNNIKSTVKGQKRVVILAHDSEVRYETVKALPDIIEFLRDEGYSFETCDNDVEPIVFAYPRNWR